MQPASEDLSPQALIGQLVGRRYRITRIIGSGGAATVFEAQRVSPPLRCAIKVLTLDQTDPTQVERFRLEAEISWQLVSEHSVEFIDTGELPDGRPYLVMEYLEGEDLATRLARQGRLDPQEVVFLLEGIARILTAAHERHIIHRDLKPANLFLARRPGGGEVVKVLDFGAAKLQGSNVNLTATGLVVGTPWYMSPEQARGQPLDGRSDEFSLGIVLFEMLTGRVPFHSESPHEVLFQLASDPHPRLHALVPELPAAIDDVFDRALAKRPADRYPSIQALSEAVRQVLYDPSRPAPLRRPVSAERVGDGEAHAIQERASEVLAGLLGEESMAQAEALQRSSGGELTEALLRLGMSEDELLGAFVTPTLSRVVKAEKVRSALIPDAVVAMVPEALAVRLRVLPFGWAGITRELRVFAAVPLAPDLEAELKAHTPAQRVGIYLATPGAVYAGIRRWYHGDVTAFARLKPNGAGPTSPRVSALRPQPALSPFPPLPSPPEPVPEPEALGAPEIDAALDAEVEAELAAAQVSEQELEPSTGSTAVVANPLLAAEAEEAALHPEPEEAELPPDERTDPRFDVLAEEARTGRVLDIPPPPMPADAAPLPWAETEHDELALPEKGAELEFVPVAAAAAPPLSPARPLSKASTAPLLNQAVAQALQRVAEVLGADRVAVVLESGEAWGQPPLPDATLPLPEALREQARVRPGGVWLDDAAPALGAAGIPWLASVSAAMAIKFGESLGQGGVLFAGLGARPPAAAAAGELLVLQGLATQVGLVVDGARSAAGRLDLELWGKGERFLGPGAPAQPAWAVEATALCVDVRPLLAQGSLSTVSLFESLNRVYEEAARVVYAHGGLVERIQGDGLVALWGTLAPGEDDARRALLAASALLARLDFLGGETPLPVNLGVHTGTVLLGRVGGAGRSVYSAIGPAVAMGWRLGALSPGQVVTTRATLAQVKKRLPGKPRALSPLPPELDADSVLALDP
jgi:class 3 adenylate cyclase